jgi:hypothetical protein
MSTDTPITGNKGEWSELYVVLKLLADGVLYPGDANLEPILNGTLKVLAVERCDALGEVNYKLMGDKILVTHHGLSSVIQVEECAKRAGELLAAIKAKSDQKGARAIPETAKWMVAFEATSLKAKSTSKADIAITLHDLHTGASPKLSFSVKSYLGGEPTLLNASQQTNVTFPLKDCDAEQRHVYNTFEVNGKKSYRDALATLKRQPDANLALIDSVTFRKNLGLIDAQLIPILSQLVLLHYQGQADSRLETLCALIEKINPLNVDEDQVGYLYKYKVKRFLVCVALGLTPGKLWSGEYFANGGYVIIKKDGALVSYHVYTLNQFENYLFANTRLETPDSRSKFGLIYEETGDFFLKLNLQIRFTT